MSPALECLPAVDRSPPGLPAPVCPRCRAGMGDGANERTCQSCGAVYPIVAGIVDLRLESDRYLNLDEDRARAERLAELESRTDLRGLAAAYYEMAGERGDRRARFLAHLMTAEARAEALVRLLGRRARILEVGCGSGGLLVAAARAGHRIIGVDLASRWLVVARRRLADRRLVVPLVAAGAERLPWPDGSFDAVVADSLLEHLDHPAKALAEWLRVLRPGGRLIVWSPNRFTLTTDPHVGLWGLGWLPRSWVSAYVRWRRGNLRPILPFGPREAARLVAAAGFAEVVSGPPRITPSWAEDRPWAQRLAVRCYARAHRIRPLQAILGRLGPLWEIQATRPGDDGHSGLRNGS